MTRAAGFYRIKRAPEEAWTVGRWGRSPYGDFRWTILGYQEMQRGPVYRVGRSIAMPKERAKC